MCSWPQRPRWSSEASWHHWGCPPNHSIDQPSDECTKMTGFQIERASFLLRWPQTEETKAMTIIWQMQLNKWYQTQSKWATLILDIFCTQNYQCSSLDSTAYIQHSCSNSTHLHLSSMTYHPNQGTPAHSGILWPHYKFLLSNWTTVNSLCRIQA